MKVLFVCIGNSGRSVIAERHFRDDSLERVERLAAELDRDR